MPELFETAKKQLANIIYDEDNFHKDDITKIEDDLIFYKKTEIGKLLIKNNNLFGIIKYLNENFNFKNEFDCGKAKIKINKPKWI